MTQLHYQDQQIKLYSECIVINKYYFPLATSKTIMFDQIQYLALRDADEVDQKWGLCGKYMNNWFPYDKFRDIKKKFIEIKLKGQKIRPSITPDQPEKVFALIWEYHTQEGKEYLSECTQRVRESRLQSRVNEKQNMNFSKKESQVVKEDPMERVSKNRLDDDQQERVMEQESRVLEVRPHENK